MQSSKQDNEYLDIKKQFHAKMLELVDEYKRELTNQKLSLGAINGHVRVASLFVNHINGYTNHVKFKDITATDANKKFLAHVKWEGLSDWDPKEIKIKLKRFFEFLDLKGFQNEKVLNCF